MRRLACIVFLLGLATLPVRAEAAASLELHDLDGVPRSLEEHRGRIVVLNFWATWCIPCREEMPVLLEIRDRYSDRGVEVVAVSTDEPGARKKVERFVRRQKMTFPVWVGAVVKDMSDLHLGDALPATAILDAEGKVAFRILGRVTAEDLAERIDYLLGDGSGEAPARLIDGFEAEAESDDDHGHEHDHDHEEEAHDHGEVGKDGASLVPS